MNIREFKTQFLEYLEVEKNRSQRTIANYDHYLSRFFSFARISKPTQITSDMVRKFRIYLNRFTDEQGNGLKKITQNFHVVALRAFLKYLTKRDVPALAPEKIELGKSEQREVSFLDDQDLKRFLNAPEGKKLRDLRDKAILETLFSTGLRVSELCALNRDEMNTSRGEITVKGKGGKVRLVFLSDIAKEKLKDYLKKRKDIDNAVFVRIPKNEKFGEDENFRISPRSVQRLIKKYVVKAGIVGKKVSPHTIRHSLATDLLRNGADIRSVQALLGHSSIKTTQIYTHVTDEQLREVHKKFHKRNK